MTPARLLELLGNSADTARPLSEIAELTGTPLRAVQKASELAKDAGIPLVAAPNGLYAAITPEDALTSYRQNRARALGGLRRAAAIKRTWQRMARAEKGVEQTELWAA